MTSILTLCTDAAVELSLISPGTLFGAAAGPTSEKLLRHLTRTCRKLNLRHDWQKQRREKTFVTVSAAAQTNALATDFQRFVPDTMFNRTIRRRVRGPLRPSEWQSFQASTTTPILESFIQRGNSVLFTPVPSAGETVAYEYITTYIGTDGLGATERETFTDNEDITAFDDELVILGTVWSYRKAEGLDYSEEFRDFELRLADLIKMDGGRKRLDMDDNLLDRTPNVVGSEIDYFVTT